MKQIGITTNEELYEYWYNKAVKRRAAYMRVDWWRLKERRRIRRLWFDAMDEMNKYSKRF